MRPDVEVSQSGSVGQDESEGRSQSTLSPTRFEDVGDGAGAEGVTLEGVVDGGGEFLRPVVVEQGEQPSGVGSQSLAALGEPLEEGGGGGDGGAEAVAGGVDVGLSGGGEQAFQVVGVLDGLSGVVGAAMAGELGLLIEDADAGVAGEQGQGLSDVGVGDGVEIAVEADVGCLAGADDAHEVGLEGMGGERQQAGLLVGPDLGDGTVGLLGMAPSVGCKLDDGWGALLDGPDVATLAEDPRATPISITDSRGGSWTATNTEVVSRNQQHIVVRDSGRP